MALTLAANIDATTETITVSGTVPGIAIKGFRFAIDNEAMEFRRFAGVDEPYPLPTVNTTWIVYRAVTGTSAASHTAGATLYAVRDALTKGADVATVPSPFPEGGTELSADIVDALEGAASPDASNVFATADDLAAKASSTVEATGGDPAVQALAANTVDGSANASLKATASGELGVGSVILGAYAQFITGGQIEITAAPGFEATISIGATSGTKIGFLGADPASRPEIPATPNAQDIADVLVLLGLATQAAP